MSLLKNLFRKEDRFFHLLEASAEEGRASVKGLEQILKAPSSPSSLDQILQARDKERQIQTEIDVLLCEGTPPPLPREDIEALARALYRIPKGTKKFAERFLLCAPQLGDISFDLHAQMLQTATETIHEMVVGLRGGTRLDAVKERNKTLQTIEGEADKLLVARLDELYHGQHDLLRAVMLKDLSELLERVFDRCRNAGNILLQIALKQS
jgi:uncharacterized protein